MDKIVDSIDAAVAGIYDGAVVLIGGFGGSGDPYNLIDAVARKKVNGLTIVSNDWTQWTRLLENGQVEKLICGFTNHPFRPEVTRLAEELYRAGKLELDTLPHGILDERIRAAKVGVSAFYCQVGIGTELEDGRQKRIVDGKECLLYHALHADFALIKGHTGDRFGNVQCRFAAANRNVTMAGAAKVTIAEVEHIVEAVDPERVTIPGIFVQRIVKMPKVVLWLDGHERPGYVKTKETGE